MAPGDRPLALTAVGVLFMLSSLLGAIAPDISPFHFLLQIAAGIAVIKNLLRGRKWTWMVLQADAAYNTALAVTWFDALHWWVAVPVLFSLSPLVLLWRSDARAYFGVQTRVRGIAADAIPPLKKHQRTLEQIERFIADRKPAKALALCRKVIDDLADGVGNLTPELCSCLGRAYLAQGGILEQQGELWPAAQSYLAARPFLSLPAAAHSFMALQLAERKEETGQAVEVYLEYLRSRRELPASGTEDPVYAILQNLCRIEEEASSERFAAARDLCLKVLEADEGLEWAHFFLGYALFRSGDWAGALSRFETSLRLRPDRREAAYFGRLCRGALKEAKGARQEALGLYREAAALAWDRPDAHYLIAMALVSECEEAEAQDEPDAASRLARLAAEATGVIVTALSRRPTRAEYHFLHGRVRSFAGESREAVEAYRKAIDLSPKDKSYYLHLAMELGRLSDGDAALEEMERALSLDRGYADGYRVRGDLLGMAGRNDLAVAEYRQALDLSPGHNLARLGLGRALYRLGRYGEAIAELEQVMPRSRETSFLLARSYSSTDQFPQAVYLLEHLASRPDAGADTFYYLGCARANAGRYLLAIEALGACLERAPARWQAHLQRGHCHLALREYGKAMADYEKTGELNPDGPEASIALARCHLLSGNAVAAQSCVERTVHSHPDSWEGNMMLGILAERADDFPGAEKGYLAALRVRPGSPEPFVRLGLMFYRQGRHSEACAYLKRAAGAGRETDPVLFSLGYAQAECADYAGALETWRKLRQRHPKDQRLALNIDRLHYLKGRQHVDGEKYEEAAAAWRECLKMRPDDEKLRRDIAELYFRLALTRLGAGESREEARRSLVSAMEMDGEHAYLPFYLALLDLVDGQQAKATRQFGDLSAAGTPSIRHRARYYQGIGLLQEGENDRAAEVLRTVVEGSCRPEMDAPVEWALAAALARGGHWEESLVVLRPVMS